MRRSQHLARWVIAASALVALSALACGRGAEGLTDEMARVNGSGTTPSSVVVVNLLGSAVNELVVEYGGAAPVRFPTRVPVEPGETATRFAVARLPAGGETLGVSYVADGNPAHHEAEVPARPSRNTVPVAVLLPDGIAVEWYDADGNVYDLSEHMKAKYAPGRP